MSHFLTTSYQQLLTKFRAPLNLTSFLTLFYNVLLFESGIYEQCGKSSRSLQASFGVGGARADGCPNVDP